MDAEEEGGPFGIGVTLATLQQTGKLPKRRSSRNTTARRGARTTAVGEKEVKRVKKGEQAKDEMVKDVNGQILRDGVEVRRR